MQARTRLDELVLELAEYETLEMRKPPEQRRTKILVAREEYYKSPPGESAGGGAESAAQLGGRRTYYMAQILPLYQFLQQYMENPSERFWHEIVLPERPCRLYVDIEFYNIDFAEAEGRRMLVEAEVARRLDDLGAKQPLQQQARAPSIKSLGKQKPLRFDASVPGKYSVHLVYPDVWFASGRDAGAFMQDVTFVDMHYPVRNKPVWFRMPYSEKRGRDNPLLPRKKGLEVPQTKAALNTEILARALVSTWSLDDSGSSPLARSFPPPPRAEHLYKVALPVPAEDAAWSRPAVSLLPPGEQREVAEELRCRAERVLEYLRLAYSPSADQCHFYGFATDERGGWSCIATPGFFCHAAGRTHRANNVYIHSPDAATVYMACPDAECRRRFYFRDEDFARFSHTLPDPLPTSAMDTKRVDFTAATATGAMPKKRRIQTTRL